MELLQAPGRVKVKTSTVYQHMSVKALLIHNINIKTF